MTERSLTSIQRWLESYCGQTAVVAAGVIVRSEGSADAVRMLAAWPAQGDALQPLVGAAAAALTRRQAVTMVPPVALPDTGIVRIVALPIQHTGDAGALAIGLRSAEDSVVQGFLGEVQRLGATLAQLLQAPDAAPLREAGRLLQLQSVLLGRARLAEAALAFANELAATFAFDRVAVGLVEDGACRIEALSHNADFDRGQDLLRCLAAAMDEAADQGCVLVQPPRPGDRLRIQLAHAELAGRTGAGVCSIPLTHDSEVIGVLTLERVGLAPPMQDELAQCEHLAALVAPLIALRRQAERPWRARLLAAVRQTWQHLQRGDDPRLRTGALVAGVVLLAALVVPLPYRVGAAARIEGAEQRVLAAPVDGYLRKAAVRPGDTVKSGQVLAEMVDQDLLLEERRWQAELSQHENAFIAAMARADRPAFSVSRAKAGEARAQLELVRNQLARMQIVAPIDGLVIEGDLTQSLGAPVKRGDSLLTLAPQSRHRLMVEVDERDIGRVAPGADGELSLAALPGESLAFRVMRITPVAVQRNGNNVFEVEAAVDGGDALRPGMQGVARVDAGHRPLAWTLTHRAWDWLRLSLFSWGL